MANSLKKCWEQRGCDSEMQSRCPHNQPGEPCPADCQFAACFRTAHKVATDFNIILNPDLNYEAAVKQVCRICENFLLNGPFLTGYEPDPINIGNPNRFLL